MATRYRRSPEDVREQEGARDTCDRRQNAEHEGDAEAEFGDELERREHGSCR